MKYIIISIFLSTLMVFTSCDSVMDTKPLDSYTENEIWNNYSLAEGYMFTCYNNVVGGEAGYWNYDVLTDAVINSDWGGSYVNEKTGLLDKYADEGWNNFGNIRAVNLALEKLKTTPFTDIQKKTLLGEAYFLRSMLYFREAKKFGGVQLVKRVLTPTDDFIIGRSSIKDTYDFILSDLDSAAVLLPETNDRGRATKGAAYALKMRVGLQAGAYLNTKSYYQQVINAGNLLFGLNKYKLDSYSNLFNHYATASGSSENILVYDRLAINTTFGGTPMQTLLPNIAMIPDKLTPTAMKLYPLAETSEGWMNFAPTQNLVNDYLVTDTDGSVKTWDQTSYITHGKNVNQKMYQHRDLRFYATIVYDSTKLYKNLLFTRANGNASNSTIPLKGGVITGGGTATGYIFRKYVYEEKKQWYSDATDFCYSILRLGEAYLNYAEAALQLGDEATARTYISKTYKAHGGFSNDITATGDALWTAYKRERNVEMVLENGDRYWSLLRWGMQKTGGLIPGYQNTGYIIPELNGKLKGIAIDSLGINYQIFEKNELNGLPLKFNPKRYLYPVPYGQIRANNKLTQNPGWE